ncbi:LuxR C-terminal-related transcriptional regulator [Streptomyces sp. NPDC058405]|uniref:LuxR C-terminal-related transcriptional regulator n=1 Tax=Streptomyces sp. NPDC058405 TaxID=3346482 RepID=UPI0036614917
MSVVGRTAPMPFTGRTEELTALHAALRRPGCKGAAVTGAPGVGKSRLAEEFVGRTGPAHRTVRVLATLTASTVPLSALAPLLPAHAGAEDPAVFFREVRQSFAATGGGSRTVLLVDDVHLLDPTSLALLGQLAADSSVFLVATLPTDADWPDVLHSLWRADALDHLRLPAFSRPEMAGLLRAALAGAVSAPAELALWEVGLGNALWTREVVRTAVRDGSLVQVDGVWCLARPLKRLPAVVPFADRMRDLPRDRRTVLELLALCGPVGLDDALEHADADALVDLEVLDVLTVRLEDRRERVALAHPWQARLLRDAIPRTRARQLLRRQAERVRGYGARRVGDALDLACWDLDANGTADPALLVRAAAQALHAEDLATMRRLAGAALVHGPDVRACLMLGEALGQQGEFGEAVPVLERAFGAAATEEDVQAAAAVLAQHCLYGLGDLERARAVLREAAVRIRSRPLPVAYEATLLTAVGRTGEAAALFAGQTAPDPRRPTAMAGQEYVAHLHARLRIELGAGLVEDAVRTGREAYAAHCDLADRWAAYYPARHLYLLAVALLESGRTEEAERTAREGRETMGAPVPALTVWFSWVLGRIALERGQVAASVAHFREARAQALLCGQPFAGQRALAGLVLATAHAGRIAPEAEELAALAARPASPLCGLDTLRAHGWVLLLRGETPRARRLLRRTADDALAAGEVSGAVTVLHDLVRWGVVEAAEDLRAAAARMQGPFAAARAAHAAAVLGPPGGTALEEAAALLEALSAGLQAAEALVAAAGRWSASGQPSRATRAAAHARILLERCPDAATPALSDASAPEPLSSRERDIALMAARGRTSREIAEACVLSVRTVENHLSRVYRKLGVSSRATLAGVLLPRPSSRS